jgi:hypothetical protein
VVLLWREKPLSVKIYGNETAKAEIAKTQTDSAKRIRTTTLSAYQNS